MTYVHSISQVLLPVDMQDGSAFAAIPGVPPQCTAPTARRPTIAGRRAVGGRPPHRLTMGPRQGRHRCRAPAGERAGAAAVGGRAAPGRARTRRRRPPGTAHGRPARRAMPHWLLEHGTCKGHVPHGFLMLRTCKTHGRRTVAATGRGTLWRRWALGARTRTPSRCHYM